jgi:hypothetical protein
MKTGLKTIKNLPRIHKYDEHLNKPMNKNNKIISWMEIATTTALLFGFIVLHCIFLVNAGPLWRDEICAVNLSNLPTLSQIWQNLQYDSFPLLWFSILKVWTYIGLGDTDFSLRILGFLVGLGLLGSLWFAIRSLGIRLPLISLSLFALCPVMLIGDTIRAYGLGSLLILLSLGAMWRSFLNPAPWQMIAAIICVLLSVQCLYHNSFLILAVCVGVSAAGIYRRAWKLILFPLGAGLLAAISVLPYFEVVSQRNNWGILMNAPVDLAWIISKFQLATDASGISFSWIWTLLALFSLISFLIVLLKPKSTSDKFLHQRELSLFLLITMLLSIIAYISFLIILSYPMQYWYFLPLMAVIIVIIEKEIDNICQGSSAGRIMRIVFVIGVSLFIFTDSWTTAHTRRTNIDLLAAKIETVAEKNDLIVIRPFYYGITFNRYYRGNASWITIPEVYDLRATRQDIIKSIMTKNDPLETSMQKIIETLQNGHRVWFIGSLKLPELGRIPLRLPPAPYSPYGWNEVAYQIAWSQEVNYIIQTYGGKIERVEAPTKYPVNKLEDPPLYVVSAKDS